MDNDKLNDKIIELLLVCELNPSETNIEGLKAYCKLLKAAEVVTNIFKL